MNAVEQINARWEPDGSITPLRFTVLGRDYVVESVGRAWRDDDGYHVLCMAGGNAVYELVLSLDLTWRVREPAGRKMG
ncbi:MAG TPA: hypothetical protein PJ988_01985 [Anaerolinea sp.]|nr:hypothetical protein [Anaerolinea sp.]